MHVIEFQKAQGIIRQLNQSILKQYDRFNMHIRKNLKIYVRKKKLKIFEFQNICQIEIFLKSLIFKSIFSGKSVSLIGQFFCYSQQNLNGVLARARQNSLSLLHKFWRVRASTRPAEHTPEEVTNWFCHQQRYDHDSLPKK